MQNETPQVVHISVPKNLINGEASVARKIDPDLSGFEVENVEFNLFELQKAKKQWQDEVNRLNREFINANITTQEELFEHINNIKAATINREIVKEAHGVANQPILADIYFRESTKELQDALFLIKSKMGSKKRIALKGIISNVINELREKKVTTEGVLTGYNTRVKIKLNLFKVN